MALDPNWPIKHPIRAYREGWRIVWPWSRDDDEEDGDDVPWEVPLAVEDLANTEAWRLTGKGAGLLSAELEPALCQRMSDGDYLCVCDIPASSEHPVYRVEIRIAYIPPGEPQITESVLREV